MPDGCEANGIPPGRQVEERNCERSGARTVHYLQWISGDPLTANRPHVWTWVCTGLTADDFLRERDAAGGPSPD
jgi:hypothetical protein